MELSREILHGLLNGVPHRDLALGNQAMKVRVIRP